jgi:hypothetical protein
LVVDPLTLKEASCDQSCLKLLNTTVFGIFNSEYSSAKDDISFIGRHNFFLDFISLKGSLLPLNSI